MSKRILLIFSLISLILIGSVALKTFVLNLPKDDPQKIVTEYLYELKQKKLDFIRSQYVSDSAQLVNLANLKTVLEKKVITKFIFNITSVKSKDKKASIDVTVRLQLDPIEAADQNLKGELPSLEAIFLVNKEGDWLKGYSWKIRDVTYSGAEITPPKEKAKETESGLTIEETTESAETTESSSKASEPEVMAYETITRPKIEPTKPQEVKVTIDGFEIKDSLLVGQGNRGITNAMIIMVENKDDRYGLYWSEFTVLMKDDNNNVLSANKPGRYGTPIIHLLPPKIFLPLFATFDKVDQRATSIGVTNSGSWRDFSKVTIPDVKILSSEYRKKEAGDIVIGEVINNSKKSQNVDILISIFDKNDKLVNGGTLAVENIPSKQKRSFEAEMLVQNPGFRMDVLALPQRIEGF